MVQLLPQSPQALSGQHPDELIGGLTALEQTTGDDPSTPEETAGRFSTLLDEVVAELTTPAPLSSSSDAGTPAEGTTSTANHVLIAAAADPLSALAAREQPSEMVTSPQADGGDIAPELLAGESDESGAPIEESTITSSAPEDALAIATDEPPLGEPDQAELAPSARNLRSPDLARGATPVSGRSEHALAVCASVAASVDASSRVDTPPDPAPGRSQDVAVDRDPVAIDPSVDRDTRAPAAEHFDRELEIHGLDLAVEPPLDGDEKDARSQGTPSPSSVFEDDPSDADIEGPVTGEERPIVSEAKPAFLTAADFARTTSPTSGGAPSPSSVFGEHVPAQYGKALEKAHAEIVRYVLSHVSKSAHPPAVVGVESAKPDARATLSASVSVPSEAWALESAPIAQEDPEPRAIAGVAPEPLNETLPASSNAHILKAPDIAIATTPSGTVRSAVLASIRGIRSADESRAQDAPARATPRAFAFPVLRETARWGRDLPIAGIAGNDLTRDERWIDAPPEAEARAGVGQHGAPIRTGEDSISRQERGSLGEVAATATERADDTDPGGRRVSEGGPSEGPRGDERDSKTHGPPLARPDGDAVEPEPEAQSSASRATSLDQARRIEREARTLMVSAARAARAAAGTPGAKAQRLSLSLPTQEGTSVRLIITPEGGTVHRVSFIATDNATHEALVRSLPEIRSAVAELPLDVADIEVVTQGLEQGRRISEDLAPVIANTETIREHRKRWWAERSGARR